MSGRCLEGIWRVFGRRRKVSGKFLYGVWQGSGRSLGITYSILSVMGITFKYHFMYSDGVTLNFALFVVIR